MICEVCCRVPGLTHSTSLFSALDQVRGLTQGEEELRRLRTAHCALRVRRVVVDLPCTGELPQTAWHWVAGIFVGGGGGGGGGGR